MDEYGVVIGEGAVRFERLLPGPIERVWAYLTEPDKRGAWLARGEMELREGGAVELRFLHAELTPHEEVIPEQHKGCENGAEVAGTITQCDPPRLLAYTWGESSGNFSEVAFELTPVAEGVRLVLTHRRLADRAEMIDVASGWHTHLGILSARLDNREPDPFWAAHTAHEAAYARHLP